LRLCVFAALREIFFVHAYGSEIYAGYDAHRASLAWP
jgi:hypothetical protein